MNTRKSARLSAPQQDSPHSSAQYARVLIRKLGAICSCVNPAVSLACNKLLRKQDFKINIQRFLMINVPFLNLNLSRGTHHVAPINLYQIDKSLV